MDVDTGVYKSSTNLQTQEPPGGNVDDVDDLLSSDSTPETPVPSDVQPICRFVDDSDDLLSESDVGIMLGILELSVDVADLDSFSKLPKHHKDQLWGEASPELQARLKEIRQGTAA